MFSLCIPTIDRYDSFLKENLKKYLENNLIDEIIITDENGNDIDKIIKDFDNNKLKLFKNEKILGPFFNKLKCCKLTNSKWIALIDSDNFADSEYFIKAEEYIKSNNLTDQTILAPSFAKQDFDYRDFQNKIIERNDIKNMLKTYRLFETFLNTGNYIINSFLINNLNIVEQDEDIFKTPADVLLFLILLFEQFDLKIHVISDMHYTHSVHDGSVYRQTCNKYNKQIQYINSRLQQLIT